MTPSGVRIVPSKHFPKHPTRRHTVRFEAHPLVCWLARWLPIKPYIEADYPDDADPVFFADKNTIICGTRHFELLKAEGTRP